MAALADRGFGARLRPVFPAVTCSVQASFLTGAPPRDHGIVANGWYFRDLAQVWLWRQSNHLVQGIKLYEEARRADPAFTCAKLFWWWNMYADVDWSVTPRPEYHADGLKRPGIYTHPAELGPRLQAQLGDFPLFEFWGPAAGIASTRWIVDSALAVQAEHDPALTLVYLPHLDYDHQRYGPDDPRSHAQVPVVDREVQRLIDAAGARGAEIAVLSEYGIEAAHTPVMINRHLAGSGWLAVQRTGHGQLLDAGASRAFAVADHQVAHVYVRDPSDLGAVAASLRRLDGVEHVLDREAQAAWQIDHPRSGELVCVAAPGCWFAYHYWLDDREAPDFARTVDIHRKPGYDPTELFLDPGLRLPKARIAKTLLKKKLGFRYLMDVIGLDPTLVRGTHGRLYEDPAAGPVFLSSTKAGAADEIDAVDVRQWILDALRSPGRATSAARPPPPS